jgi:multidrug efflux pump subunit AcrA (membrane-fusion protein)
MARTLTVILALLSLGLAIWQVRLLVRALGRSKEPPRVETALVKEGPFVVGITRDGTLRCADVASVRAQRWNSLLTWLIEDGAEVKEGDLIAKLDVSEVHSWLSSAQLDFQRAEAEVGQTKRDRERDYELTKDRLKGRERALELEGKQQQGQQEEAQAQLDYDDWQLKWTTIDRDRQERLGKAGLVPAAHLEQAERGLRSKQRALAKTDKRLGNLKAEHAARREETKGDVETIQFELQVAQGRIGESVKLAEQRVEWGKRRLEEAKQYSGEKELRAPRGGVIVLGRNYDQYPPRALKAGDRLTRSTQVAGIVNLADLAAELRVEEAAASKLKVGQKVIVTVKGAPGREFEGRVKDICPVAREANTWEDSRAIPGQRVFDFRVVVLKPDPKVLRPGAKAKVQFVLRRLPKRVYLPLEALQQDEQGRTVVYVQRGWRFEKHVIETGERNDEAVAVSRGVRAGERVALGDPTRMEER